jgi:UDP:flavonoid glycosyltransferase YjiC (YdhE family)/pimeloyl-ACP methyl ester carboxylesterase
VEAAIRAREPDQSGYATAHDGLRLYWEEYGSADPTILVWPANPISHSRLWKAQIHYLARHHRLVVYDGRGNGRSDAPDPAGPFVDHWRVADAVSVMDATGTDAAVMLGICGDGVWPSIQLAGEQPGRVLGIFAISPGVPLLTPPHENRGDALEHWDEAIEDPRGWQKMNRHYILADHRGFLQFFFREMFPEPHSEKQIEDAVEYGLAGRPEVLAMDDEFDVGTTEEVEAVCRKVRCPVLVMHGDLDNCQPFARGVATAELTGAEHIRLTGAGHIPNARDPVLVNRLIHDFASRFDHAEPRTRVWRRASTRPRRALVVSSPIGLGHAWRDVAIARELRRQVPGLEVHWLAQAPLTTLLAECGETVHPMSAHLAPEAAHVDAESGEHQLHCFQMLRRLDEIFCANFMVFHDLVQEEPFDVWIADEAWELDYFLHENPELKTAPYVWMTDFVGVLPMPGAGEREQFLTADWNEQMVEHVARHPRLRDRSIFIGDPADVVAEPLGPGLPSIPDWTGDHFQFAGYVTGFEPDEIADREALRAEFGWGPGEQVCVVATGGAAVGVDLLQRAVAAKRHLPEVRMVVVAGPRIDPAALSANGDVEVLGYVHKLYRLLAACDIAITHGGLSTTMELTAAGRPFLTYPLRDHFEQNLHVAHRLDRHRAGRRMSYETDGPEELAAAVKEELARERAYAPIAPGGAARAAGIIAELL